MWNRISVMTSTLQKTVCFHHHGSGYDFIHIRVCYVEPYQCHDINITEDNGLSSSWFWLWFSSYTCLLCGTVLVSWHQHYRRQCVVIIMVLVKILFIYVYVVWNRISVMTSTLQKTMCCHHHDSGYNFIHIRVGYVEPYQCHDINITEYNVFSSSWFWLWFYSYTCMLCGTVSVSWHQHYRIQCVFIIMVLVMILFIYVSIMWDRISVMTSTLQKTMCCHHHGSGYDFIHIRVYYVGPYQCHDINITEDNVFSSSWFWLWFYSYTCLLCGIVSVSWHQHYRRQCVFIIMVLVMILFIYVHSWAMKTSARRNASRNTSSLWGESTGQRRIPSAKDSNVKFLVINLLFVRTSTLIWDAMTPMWRHCNVSSGTLYGVARVPCHKLYHRVSTFDMSSGIGIVMREICVDSHPWYIFRV